MNMTGGGDLVTAAPGTSEGPFKNAAWVQPRLGRAAFLKGPMLGIFNPRVRT